ncbi:MAG: DUF3422 domain-containing protein [Nitrospirota bacterium]|nr:DUF3422 domain-containing protein [Nitrospirota bacterium]MDH5585529.1 DUF3422 domain-containing protein [Nitrospirota bacterium]
MPLKPPSTGKGILRHIHTAQEKYLEGWLKAPAHIHHTARRMANPAIERPQSRKEFQQLLSCLNIEDSETVLEEKVGFGVKTTPNGDRLIAKWEAHTEYYSYQIWHIPQASDMPLGFGPLTFPQYVFPFSPLGLEVNALDIVVTLGQSYDHEELGTLLPGPQIYGSHVLMENISVATSFTPDEHGRERYLIWAPEAAQLLPKLPRLIDILITLENYTHLILLPYKAFSRSVDQVQIYEQRHLYQRSVITKELKEAKHARLQQWLEGLTHDFLEVGRLADSMRFRLSASVPYDRIVHSNTLALQEQALPGCRTLTDYVHWKITGVADGYQQLMSRIHALEQDFEGTIAVLRTKVELVLQEQNLAQQDQNMKLLASVDQTTKSQAILQQTVEGLSVIVIAYYVSGLANYLFKAFHEMGWLSNYTLASGIFVPIAIGLAYGLITWGKKRIHQTHSSPPTPHD